MNATEQQATQLLAWYTVHARPFLQHHARDRIAAFDDNGRRVETLCKEDIEDVAACFLGAAGVGKSTLLNAIVSERLNVLPHGGIGSLTAQATIVRFAAQPFLRVEYFPSNVLRGILLALETHHSTSAKDQSPPGDVIADLSPSEVEDAEATAPASENDNAEEGVRDKLEAYQRQLRLMIQGDQRGAVDLPYLLDALRAALGLQPRWGRAVTPQDLPRTERLRTCLRPSEVGVVRWEMKDTDKSADFLAAIRDHASGFLAPIIKKLEVGWNAELLQDGLILVDLPGVGVASDEYHKVTAEWLRERARAIVLVVDTRGVTEATAELLRSTGFLASLLHDGDDASVVPVALAVAMVKIDLSTDSAWQDDFDIRGDEARSWNAHFEEARARAVDMVRDQMRQELQKVVLAGPEAVRAARETALQRVLATLQVHPVSAPQYRALAAGHPLNKPRITNADESGIPDLARALHSLSVKHRSRRRAQAEAALRDFRELIRAELELIKAQWSAETRAAHEAEQLVQHLDAFLVPRQRELATRGGGFREFLRNGVPEQIQAAVTSAAAEAHGDITRYLRRLGNMHWATLRATVRRGGAYVSQSSGHRQRAGFAL